MVYARIVKELTQVRKIISKMAGLGLATGIWATRVWTVTKDQRPNLKNDFCAKGVAQECDEHDGRNPIKFHNLLLRQMSVQLSAGHHRPPKATTK